MYIYAFLPQLAIVRGNELTDNKVGKISPKRLCQNRNVTLHYCSELPELKTPEPCSQLLQMVCETDMPILKADVASQDDGRRTRLCGVKLLGHTG